MKDIFQGDKEVEYEAFLFHAPSFCEEWSQLDTQEDFYTPMRCSNANLQPKVRPQLGSLDESKEITLTHDRKGSQMGETLTCLGKEDILQIIDRSASETKTKFEELDDK